MHTHSQKSNATTPTGLVAKIFKSTKAKFAAAAGVAMLAVLAASPAQAAQEATAKSSLNVRSGPGTNYVKVDTLYGGEKVQVHECNYAGWCYITHPGPDGWVSRNYLWIGPVNKPSTYHNPAPKPSVSANVQISPNVSLSFSFGNGNARYHHNPRACFYKHANYNGASFCVKAGDSFRSLPGNWNDQISSIKVFDGATVTYCKHARFNGICRTISNNKSYVGNRFNDQISSAYVR